MSLRDLEIKNEYRSKITDVVSNFFLPVLNESCSYKRSVGFFSSSSLVEISRGICSLAKRGGTIKLVTSPCLSDEDVKAIKDGYKKRDEVIRDALIRELKEPNGELEADRLALLADLIATGILDIKVAIIDNGIGIYHEKLGLMEDQNGNIVAFSGSMNESKTAIRKNYESIDVFCSWNDKDSDRVREKKQAFDAIWNGYESGIEVLEFPEVSDEIIRKYKRNTVPDFSIDENEFGDAATNYRKQGLGARIPKEYNPLRDYQEEAIKNWARNGYKGIFDMATGTGKTLTALGGIVNLSNELSDKINVVIVCPFQHLVEQWSEDVEKFNMNPIVAFSNSPQKKWKELLKQSVLNSKYNQIGFCLLTTNSTFKSDFIQKQLYNVGMPILLIIDEAHNAGANDFKSVLENNGDKFEYRLALSATLERHMDDVGTAFLFNFFGEKCIEYTLEEAISQKMLTPYKYYPVIIYLDEDELAEYRKLSIAISRLGNKDDTKTEERRKMLLLKRARVVAGAKQKNSELLRVIEPYKNERNILVYCGSVKYSNDFNYCDNGDEIRQIDLITKTLYKNLGMKVSQFTSLDSPEQRMLIKEAYNDENGTQAIIAIKCLDEGVNIPGIKTAFILASTTNPKEYIQRRGRVLRLSDGKEYAEIYDFITLPRPLEDVSLYESKELKSEQSMVKSEILRMEEFSRLALNKSESSLLVYNMKAAYEEIWKI